MKDFPRRYLPDVAVGILIMFFAIIWGLEVSEETVHLFICICAVIWCLIQYFYYKNLIGKGVPTEAILLDYHYQHEKGKPVVQGMPAPEYTVYAPVVQYETDSEVITSRYCMHLRKRRYEIGEKIRICYLPSSPELFWFPDEKEEMYKDYIITAVISVIIMIVYSIAEMLA